MESEPPVEHFSLRWNNFQSTITSALAGLRDTQAFVDVTLWADGQQIKAHRNVLSACSPVLLELLKVRIGEWRDEVDGYGRACEGWEV